MFGSPKAARLSTKPTIFSETKSSQNQLLLPKIKNNLTPRSVDSSNFLNRLVFVDEIDYLFDSTSEFDSDIDDQYTSSQERPYVAKLCDSVD